MLREGVKPDSVTFNVVLGACSQVRAMREGEHDGGIDRISGGKLLSRCRRSCWGKIQEKTHEGSEGRGFRQGREQLRKDDYAHQKIFGVLGIVRLAPTHKLAEASIGIYKGSVQ
ncbi:hypothetical protein GOP47_0000358 [Adiantum capillus-veneris]|uniref:Uncharacterized protein n=1 Tax=Adiantum capillus-veneris TaxID=13818 RepID=A0A9D4ZQG9_ADICA|nr:hypothetical protein GOP47_0000358 [Adiantum capillus-veneris]